MGMLSLLLFALVHARSETLSNVPDNYHPDAVQVEPTSIASPTPDPITDP